MALPYFYEPTVAMQSSPFELSEETSKHCIQVLRMQEGDQLLLTNGRGALITARIASAHKKAAVVQLLHDEQVAAPTRHTCIAISLLKNATRLEWFLEKATEMGITHIVPLICQRTEHTRFRTERMQQILVAAMLQSKQCWLPEMNEPQPFAQFLNTEQFPVKLIAHCEDGPKTELQQIDLSLSSAILIGPEGDFSPEEIDHALQKGFQAVSLGHTRLRTETAGLVAATLLTRH